VYLTLQYSDGFVLNGVPNALDLEGGNQRKTFDYFRAKAIKYLSDTSTMFPPGFKFILILVLVKESAVCNIFEILDGKVVQV